MKLNEKVVSEIIEGLELANLSRSKSKWIGIVLRTKYGLDVKWTFIEDKGTDTQLFVFIDPDNIANIAIRGTQQRKDIKTNLKIKPKAITRLGYAMRVHAGYYDVWGVVGFKVLAWLRKNYRGLNVRFCCHSMGAGIGLVGVIDLGRIYEVSAYFIGMPPAGDKLCVKYISHKQPHVIHTRHRSDKVANIAIMARIAGYRRCGIDNPFGVYLPPLPSVIRGAGKAIFNKENKLGPDDLAEHDIGEYILFWERKLRRMKK